MLKKKKKVKAEIYRRLQRLFPENFQAKTSLHFLRRSKKPLKWESIPKLRNQESLDPTYGPSILWMWAVRLNPCGFSVTSTKSMQVWRFAHRHEALEIIWKQEKILWWVKFLVTRSPLHVTPSCLPSTHFHIYVCVYILIHTYICALNNSFPKNIIYIT